MKNYNNQAKADLFRLCFNLLAAAVNEQLFDGCRDWCWIGDRAGGACDFEGCDAISTEDMLLIIEEDVTYEQYAEWREAGLSYNADKEDKSQRWINLESWLMGARYEMFENVEK